MLEITRTAGQQVRCEVPACEASALLTIVTFNASRVAVRVQATGLEHCILHLKVNEPQGFEIGGHQVELHLRLIDRGQVRIGFQAPQAVRILRTELDDER